jgi:integrase
MGAFLQTLKDTAARPVEAMRIRWEDVDFTQSLVSINYPAKKCNARTLRVSKELMEMLKALPRPREKLFSYASEGSAERNFRLMRNRCAEQKGKPELRKITCYTFRHWKATVEMQETGREVDVMYLLGHTTCKYVWVYVKLAKLYFGSTPKFNSVWVNDRDTETKLNDEGYVWIRTDPRDGASLYRKVITSGAVTIGHD